MKQIIIVIIALGLTLPSAAQQEPQYTQGQFNNNLVLNPAYAGYGQNTRIGLRYRNQWAGFTGAPKTLNLIGDGRVKQGRLGIGGVLQYDQLGIETATTFDINAAYHLPLDEENNKHLSIGLKGGVSFIKADFTKLSNVMAADPLYVPATYGSATAPYIGIGAMYYSDVFFLGIAAPRLASFENVSGKNKIMQAHYYLNTGVRFTLNEALDIRPSLLLKYQAQAPLEADIALNLWYQNTLGTGISYRTGDAINFMLQYRHAKGFIMGYSYDFTTSTLRSQTFGSHEVFVGYTFQRQDNPAPNPSRDTRPF